MKKKLFFLMLTLCASLVCYSQNECGTCQNDLRDLVIDESLDGTVYCVHQDVYIYGNVSFNN